MSWVRPGPPLYIMAPPLPQWRPTGHKCSQSHFLPTPPNSFLVTMATYTRMLFGERKRSTWALRVDLVPFGKDGPGSWMSFQKRGEGQTPGVHTAPAPWAPGSGNGPECLCSVGWHRRPPPGPAGGGESPYLRFSPPSPFWVNVPGTTTAHLRITQERHLDRDADVRGDSHRKAEVRDACHLPWASALPARAGPRRAKRARTHTHDQLRRPPPHTRDCGPRAGLPRSARPGLSPSPESPRRRTRRERCRAWFRPRR